MMFNRFKNALYGTSSSSDDSTIGSVYNDYKEAVLGKRIRGALTRSSSFREDILSEVSKSRGGGNGSSNQEADHSTHIPHSGSIWRDRIQSQRKSSTIPEGDERYSQNQTNQSITTSTSATTVTTNSRRDATKKSNQACSVGGVGGGSTKVQKFRYTRPEFLQLKTDDEIIVSADHQIRPIILPRDVSRLPWKSGYAECINAGKSATNEDQAASYQDVAMKRSALLNGGTGDPDTSNSILEQIPWTYFGLFDGHAGSAVAVAAAAQLHQIISEKLRHVADLLIALEFDLKEASGLENDKYDHQDEVLRLHLATLFDARSARGDDYGYEEEEEEEEGFEDCHDSSSSSSSSPSKSSRQPELPTLDDEEINDSMAELQSLVLASEDDDDDGNSTTNGTSMISDPPTGSSDNTQQQEGQEASATSAKEDEAKCQVGRSPPLSDVICKVSDDASCGKTIDQTPGGCGERGGAPQDGASYEATPTSGQDGQTSPKTTTTTTAGASTTTANKTRTEEVAAAMRRRQESQEMLRAFAWRPIDLYRSNDSYLPSMFDIRRNNITVESLIKGVLESAFWEMDELIARDKLDYKMPGGCAAIVSLFIMGKLYVCNAGDCRAIVYKGKQVVPMSHDFTPVSERQRILRLGMQRPDLLGKEFTHLEFIRKPTRKDLGRQMYYRDAYMTGWSLKEITYDDLKFPLVWGEGKRSRVLATIGVTRGFGDHELRAQHGSVMIKPFLTPEPDVRVLDLEGVDTEELTAQDVLIMGTDGLWDVASNEEVAEIVERSLTPDNELSRSKYRYTSAAQDLIIHSRGTHSNDWNNNAWRMAGHNHRFASLDDISAFVIPLKAYRDEYQEWKRLRQEMIELVLHNRKMRKQRRYGRPRLAQRMRKSGDENPSRATNSRSERETRVS